MKYGYILVGLGLLVFGSCVARPPQEPTTVIQLENPVQASATEVSTPESAPEAEEVDEQLMAYQQYSADYLAALASTSDLAQAEFNTFLRCRASSVALAAQRDAEANNTGLEAELIKRLRAVTNDAKARAEGKRFYSHDAAGAGDFRDPAIDTQVLIMLLQTMQEANPSFPMCTQDAGSLWRAVGQILTAADEMARTAPQSVPVKVPINLPGEVAKDETD